MRIRKCVALGGATIIFLGCLIIYRMADYTLYPEENTAHFIQMSSKNKLEITNKNYLSNNKILNNDQAEEPEAEDIKTCKKPKFDFSVDVEMSEVYKTLNFDNIDGGVWKQGWNIEITPSKWNKKNKLRVFIVPHSHNDPGWVKTFEDYYTSETRSILYNMLKKLSKDPKKKFIWAEISYFSLWWDELSTEDQEKVRKLVQNGQLEIVTGGWVMNDEANSHYYSIITQLTEGHQWMKSNILVEPKNGWTIDPFGESSVMPYLLKKMGINNLVIQRVHYSIKKYFAQLKNLEFRWRQFWDSDGTYDLLTHMTPFYSYDIPHTCGPDPKICCQFDFKRLPGSGVSCPWKESPKVITPGNVAVRSQMILDQYRKKAELYRTNVILVPLGDDFRYQHISEWDNQFENYYKIMQYINTNPELYAEVKFGTLVDFFKALYEESSPENFPTVVGDFFTYADRDDHYWSGYYTSRPFYKRMDRILMSYHRAAEILFSLGWSAKNHESPNWLLAPQIGFAKMLRDTRRSLSLFQHHDGITGTARDNVMEDYARKMLTAISDSQHIIQQMSHFLLAPQNLPYFRDSEKTYFDFDYQRKYFNTLPSRRVLFLAEGETKTLVFFNSLTFRRQELVSVVVTYPFVEVKDANENIVNCQVNPVFSQINVMDENRYEIFFVAEVNPLTLTSFKIIGNSPNKAEKTTFSKVTIFNSPSLIKHSKGFENFVTSTGKVFSVENYRFIITLNERGLFIKDKEMIDQPFYLSFIRYQAKPGKERSGAYLFLPDGDAKILRESFPYVRIYKGPLFTRIEFKLNSVIHYLNLFNTHYLENLGIEIVNVVDISNESNYELGMRLTSQLRTENKFYTDLNGFQMVERKRLSKLPIQGNFYPMPTAAYIEDKKSRITILTGQPLGVSSQKEGEIEVLQDRRLMQDDNRGLGQGVLDNKITPNVFRILIEKKLKNCFTNNSLALSARAAKSSLNLLYPLQKMFWKSEEPPQLLNSYSPGDSELGIDLHLVGVRTFDKENDKATAGFVFHRSLLNTCFLDSPSLSKGIVNLDSLLTNHFGNEVRKNSLSFLHEKKTVSRKEDHLLCYLDFLALTLS